MAEKPRLIVPSNMPRFTADRKLHSLCVCMCVCGCIMRHINSKSSFSPVPESFCFFSGTSSRPSSVTIDRSDPIRSDRVAARGRTCLRSTTNKFAGMLAYRTLHPGPGLRLEANQSQRFFLLPSSFSPFARVLLSSSSPRFLFSLLRYTHDLGIA